jgi:hypothetical protein
VAATLNVGCEMLDVTALLGSEWAGGWEQELSDFVAKIGAGKNIGSS